MVDKRLSSLFAVVVLSGITVLLYYRFGSDGNGKSTASQNAVNVGIQEVPLSTAAQYILDILDNYTSRDVLLDPKTYQGRVFVDMVTREEASRESTHEFQVVQKYALLALFHASSGENWGVKFGWSTAWAKTCEWYGIDDCRLLPNGEMAIVGLDLGAYFLLSLQASVRLLLMDFLYRSG